MNIYENKSMKDRIGGNPYVGRGIVIGRSADGKKAATAYISRGQKSTSTKWQSATLSAWATVC